MKYRFTHKKQSAFALIEVIITIALIGIMSGSIYAMYFNMIKGMKSSEEKQSITVIGKRTLENMEGVPSDKFSLSDGKVIVEEVPFVKDDLNKALLTMDQLKMTGNKESFNTTLYLTKKYKYCEEKNSQCAYKEKIRVYKVMSNNGSDKKDVEVDMNVDNIDENAEDINADINTMDFNYSINKKEDDDDVSFEDETIGESDGKLVIKVYIDKTDNNKATIEMKDSDGNNLCDKKITSLDSDKLNYLNLHFNFADYKINSEKDKEENQKDIEVKVYNRIGKGNKFAANMYIEKSVDVNVDVEACKGDVYTYETDENKNVEMIGPLYAVCVDIINKETNETLFSAHTLRNIYIK